MLINGQWLAGERRFSVANPATGETLAEIPVTSPEELAAAVVRARAAQAEWGALSFEERAERLLDGARRLGELVDELADTVTREMGKPLADARREAKAWVGHTAEVLEEVREALAPTVIEEGGETTLGMSRCHFGETVVWDRYLNDEYRRTMRVMRAMDEDEGETFPEFANRGASLVKAQRAWIAFRDAECNLAYAEWGSGSMRSIAFADCMSDMTARRTLDLRAMRERFE